jgi:hypothetical protein
MGVRTGVDGPSTRRHDRLPEVAWASCALEWVPDPARMASRPRSDAPSLHTTRIHLSTTTLLKEQQDTPMTDIDLRLARKGRREPLHGLLEQATVTAGRGREHAADLARFGWTAAMTTALEADIASLQTGYADRIDTTGAARRAGDAEQTAIDDAKRFIRQLRNALPMVLRHTKVTDLNLEAFHAGGQLLRSTAKILVYLAGLQAVVGKLDADLAPYFEGKKASDALTAALTGLQGANVVQELKLDALPQATLEICEIKGRVLESIEDLNRVGKIAYDGDAGTRAAFNKDILLRARKAAKAASTEKPADAPADAKTATTSPSPAPAPKDTKEATTSPSPAPAPKDTKEATTSPSPTPPAKETKTAALEPAHA